MRKEFRWLGLDGEGGLVEDEGVGWSDQAGRACALKGSKGKVHCGR